MPIVAIDPPAGAQWLDGVRYHVPSRTDPHVTYLVELTAYSGQGICQCEDFTCRREPFLAKMITPERAVAEGLVKLQRGQEVGDALRCWHIREARKKFCDDVIQAINERTRNEG